MSEHPSANDWATARGERWRDRLDGLEAMLRPVDEPLVRALALDAPYRIADVGCGGGGTTRTIARAAPAGSAVRGFDVSPALIEAARRAAASAGGGVAFDVADVETAEAPQPPFDRLVSRFGIMFFANPAVAFARLARWLRPGGRFAFAAWGAAADNAWMSTMRDVAASLVDVPAVDPDAPHPFRYGDPARLVALLERAGFAGVACETWRGTLRMGGDLAPAAAAAFALAAVGGCGEVLAAAGGDALVRARADLTSLYECRARDGVVPLEACVNVVSGARPA